MRRTSKFAAQTKVSSDRSIGEIATLLRRFGAGQFGYLADDAEGIANVMFSYRDRNIRISVTLPKMTEFKRTPGGRMAKTNRAQALWEQETRRRWRSLALLVKAKLVAVEDGVSSFDTEFLPYIVWPGGKTTAEQLVGQVATLADSGKGPKLLVMPEVE